MISQDQIVGQVVVGGATVHLLQFFNVPKAVCPYISGAVAFLSGIGFTLTNTGSLASGGQACFAYPSTSVIISALGASLLQWLMHEGWYQVVAKPTPSPVVNVTTPAPVIAAKPEPPLPNVAQH